MNNTELPGRGGGDMGRSTTEGLHPVMWKDGVRQTRRKGREFYVEPPTQIITSDATVWILI